MVMNTIISLLIAIYFTIALFSLNSCATILSKSQYPVYIHSEPVGAEFSIMNERKGIVFEGTTPSNVILKASDGLFSKAEYIVRFTKDGYEQRDYQLNASFDPMYLGNLLLSVGGIPGLLIIDPMTGAMYKLKTPLIKVVLAPVDGQTAVNYWSIRSMDDIPVEWHPYLEMVAQ